MKKLIFVLLFLPCAAYGTTYYVNTGSTAGGDGTTNATEGANRAWPTLEAAEGQDWNLTAAGRNDTNFIIQCSGATDDTTNVNFSGWTVDSTHKVTIQGDADGVWDDNHYTLSIQSGAGIDINIFYIAIKNIQITTAGTDATIGFRHQQNNTTAGDLTIEGNIIRCTNASLGTDSSGIYTMCGTNDRVVRIGNNVIYGFNRASAYTAGIFHWGAQTLYIYNNTCYGNRIGIGREDSTQVLYIKNNICNGNYTDYGTLSTPTESATNISEDSTSPSTGNRTTAVSFTDEDNRDFTPSSAYNGTDLRTDTYAITTDAAGTTRAATPTIGALEYASGGGGTPTSYAYPQVILLQ